MTETIKVKVEGGRVVQGNQTMHAAMEMRQPVRALIDGEPFTVMPLSFKDETFNLVQFTASDELPLAEAVRCFLEGVDDYKAGRQVNENRYPPSGTDVAAYQRGYEWSRGWNQAALGKV